MDSLSPKSISSERSERLARNVMWSFGIKLWSAAIQFLLVPLTLGCLGEYTNGVWLTISSMLLWIDNMDIGLGNGMRNRLAAYLAHGRLLRARALVSSTFAMVAAIMAVTFLVIAAAIALTDTYRLFNVSPQIVEGFPRVLVATVLLVCSTFVFKLLGNFYMAIQLPAASNLLVTLGQTLALVATAVVYFLGGHSLMYVALANTVPPLLVYLAAYPYTFVARYPQLRPTARLVSLSEAKGVVSMGLKFFVMQVSAIVLFMSANLLISNLFSPAMVTPYTVAYRYLSLMFMVFAVVATPFWSATTDAYERGDLRWVGYASAKLNLLMVAILVAIVAMVAIAPWVYRLWVGSKVSVPMAMTIAMAVYVYIVILSQRYSYLINGIGKLRLQLVVTAMAALLFIPLAFLAVRLVHSPVAFIAAMCIVNLPGLVINYLQFNKLIHHTATGIWNQ